MYICDIYTKNICTYTHNGIMLTFRASDLLHVHKHKVFITIFAHILCYLQRMDSATLKLKRLPMAHICGMKPWLDKLMSRHVCLGQKLDMRVAKLQGLACHVTRGMSMMERPVSQRSLPESDGLLRYILWYYCCPYDCYIIIMHDQPHLLTIQICICIYIGLPLIIHTCSFHTYTQLLCMLCITGTI